MELARIVAGHPRLALALAISDKWAGTHAGRPPALSRRRRRGDGAPAEARRRRRRSRGWTSSSCARRPRRRWRSRRSRWRRAPGSSTCRARFGSPANEYPRWYGFTHARPDLLPAACYSMPEAGASGDIREARLVSNPGCYATASTLAVLALLRGGIIEQRRASSSTPRAARPAPGARRARTFRSRRWTATFAPTACCATSTRPRSSARWRWPGQPPLKVTFTPHLLPTRRGILATVYGRLHARQDGRRRGGGRCERFVAGKPFLRAAKPEAVRLHAGRRHQPGAAGRRRRSRARRRGRRSPRSTTW